MGTRVLKIDPDKPQQDKINTVAQIIRRGGLAIIPTETVYGLAANMHDKKAVQRLYKIKQRPKDKPFTLHIAEKDIIEDFAYVPGPLAFKLIDKFWPGPLTLILPKISVKENGTVGLRMPDNHIALNLIDAVGVPLYCPSANLSGKPPPTSLDEALRDLGKKVDVAIDGGKARLGAESSVVDLTQTPLKIKRQGALSRQDIEQVAGRKVVLFVCTGNSCRSVMAKAFLEKQLEQQRRDDIEVLSAGILGLSSLGVSKETKQVLEKEGISVQGHESRKVTSLMVKKSDIILVMEKMHEEKILEMVPQARNRLFLLKEFAKIEDSSLDIQDPIGKPIEFHGQTLETIKQAVERVIKIL